MKQFDFLIIGGGIFGIYTALFLARKGVKVGILEKERQLLQKASIVNQARLHNGYHYPRSVATALMSNENKERFTKEHQSFINFTFEKYYGIDRYGSFTDSQQFERFCNFINIQCEPVKEHPLFNYHRLEAVYKTREYTFDPILIARYYSDQLKDYPNAITLMTEHELLMAGQNGREWLLEVKNHREDQVINISAGQVVNATYAGSNSINRIFGMKSLDLTHEISEMAFVTSPQVSNTGLTVMDGQFGSIMPYGLSGLLSLSSVAYTHHKISYEAEPHFDCMARVSHCRPDFLGICNECTARPASNYNKMLAQIKNYFRPEVQFHYYWSYFTIKSKLMANYIDDGRPTEISLLHQKPPFYCIFAGKINSIYEVEKVIKI